MNWKGYAIGSLLTLFFAIAPWIGDDLADWPQVRVTISAIATILTAVMWFTAAKLYKRRNDGEI